MFDVYFLKNDQKHQWIETQIGIIIILPAIASGSR